MAINKKRLQGAAESTAIVPSENFQTVLYTGTGSGLSKTGVGFSPDLVWLKNRDSSSNNQLFDSVRGVGKTLYSDGTHAEANNPIDGYLGSFDSDGFSLSSGTRNTNDVSNSGDDYCAWCWKAGGSSNTFNKNGTGYSTASAAGLTGESNVTIQGSSVNTETGISIIKTLAGSGSGETIPHGLGTQPELIISKPLDGYNWYTFTPILNNGSTSSYTGWNFLFLDTTVDATASGLVYASNTHIYDDWASGRNVIYYSFISIPEYSKIGKYEGTFLAGNDVECGFEPAWVMIKNADATGNWIIVDNKRNPTNEKNKFLYPNEATAEGDLSAYDTIDFTTTGFVLQDHTDLTGNTNINVSGQTYIFYAVAADPDTTTPTVAKSFDIHTYTGNGGTQNIGSANTLFTKFAVFNGSSSYISTGINFSTLTNTKSISMWIKSTGSSSIGFGGMDGSSGNNGLFTFDESAGNVAYIPVFGGYHTGDASTVVTYAWNHFVVTDTNVDGNVKIYINGSEVVVTKLNSSSYVSNTDMQIGRQMRNNGNPFWHTGSIDQVRIYNTAINQTAVTLLYNETQASASTKDYPSGTGCIALYEFTDNAETTPSSSYNGTAYNITYDSFLFKPDLVIIKNTSSSNQNWYWGDTLRGVSKQLRSDSNSSNINSTPYGITAFNNAGFTVSDVTAGNNNVNGAVGGTWSGNAQFVAYSLKMLDNNNNVPIENSVGTIDSQVSANPSAGMSIVKYTGTGSTGSVGHGLSLAPEFIIAKNLDGTNSWVVRSSELGNGYLQLNDTTEYSTTVLWGTPTASVFNFTHDANGQISGNSYIAYCFHSVAGFSKFGSYTGTGSTGNAITTGFKPDFLMIKNTSSTGQWVVYDSKRDTTNAPETDTCLFMNLTDEEFSASDINISFDNNGFTLKGNNGNINGSSSPTTTTYLYWAMKIN